MGVDKRPDWKRLFRILLPLSLAVSALILSATTRELESFSRSPYPLTTPARFHSAVAFGGDVVPLGEDLGLPVEVTLGRGQTLGQLLRDAGLSWGEAQEAVSALGEHLDVRRLRAGEVLAVHLDGSSRPRGLEVPVAGEGRVMLASDDGGRWQSSWRPFERTVRLRTISGEVDGALSESMVAAGAPASLAYRVANILQWDIDFNRDVQRGDRFDALYEEISVDGELHSIGQVLAVGYENRGRRIEAYRYGDDGNYYDADGRPLQKMFLRSPMPFTRITSRFSKRRFHPVLKVYRPHYGVDYGAPIGTPVRVTAHGVVTFAGWDRGGGRTVKVRHANGYLTAYLHLSRFADDVRPGARVKQGELIGYVGATGLATGPHLDYRVKHRGTWIDPLRLDNVRAEPIPASELVAFTAWRATLQASLTGDGPDLPPEALLALQRQTEVPPTTAGG